jgi:hypothetical protein
MCRKIAWTHASLEWDSVLELDKSEVLEREEELMREVGHDDPVHGLTKRKMGAPMVSYHNYIAVDADARGVHGQMQGYDVIHIAGE